MKENIYGYISVNAQKMYKKFETVNVRSAGTLSLEYEVNKKVRKAKRRLKRYRMSNEYKKKKKNKKKKQSKFRKIVVYEAKKKSSNNSSLTVIKH